MTSERWAFVMEGIREGAESLGIPPEAMLSWFTLGLQLGVHDPRAARLMAEEFEDLNPKGAAANVKMVGAILARQGRPI